VKHAPLHARFKQAASLEILAVNPLKKVQLALFHQLLEGFPS